MLCVLTFTFVQTIFSKWHLKQVLSLEIPQWELTKKEAFYGMRPFGEMSLMYHHLDLYNLDDRWISMKT